MNPVQSESHGVAKSWENGVGLKKNGNCSYLLFLVTKLKR